MSFNEILMFFSFCSLKCVSFRFQNFGFLIERQKGNSCLTANLCKMEVPAREALLHAME